jgi:hypothetical protein
MSAIRSMVMLPRGGSPMAGTARTIASGTLSAKDLRVGVMACIPVRDLVAL